MNLKTKILLIIGVVFICAISLVYTVSRFIFIRGLEQIEEQSTTIQVEQALGVLSYLVSDLESDTADWASWDDTYEFIRNKNTDYIESNLVEDTFITLKLYSIIFIDLSGDVVYSQAYNTSLEKKIEVPNDLLNHFKENSPLLSSLEKRSMVSGILDLKQGPVIIAAQPILTSNGEGPARGILVFCRLVNDDTISELSGIVQFPISVYPIYNNDTPDIREAVIALQSGVKTVIKPLDNETVAGYSLLNDIYGRPSFLLKIDIPRDTYQLGQVVSSYYIFSILGVGILVGLLAWLLVQKRIIHRITLLIRGVNMIAETGDTSTRIALTGTDEVSLVAGTIDGMLGALEEVGKEIRESERRYRLLADNVMDVIWSTDRDLKLTYVSPSITQLTGYSAEEMLGYKLDEFIEKDAVPATMKAFEREFEKTNLMTDSENTNLSYELQLRKKDGGKVWTEIRLSVMKDSEGQVIGFVGVARDITERRQAEQLYRTLANSATVGVYIYQDGAYKFVNPQFQALTGYSEEQLLKMQPRDIVSRDDHRQARENAIRMLKGELHSPYEFKVIHPSGEPHWALETVSSIEYNGKRATLGNFMDITESKVAREELEKLYAEERNLRQSLEEEIRKRVEFTRALVHELKTPITPVLAAVELLMEEIDDDRLMRLVQSIDRSASNLNQRIDELLDLARGETDMLHLNLESIDALSLFGDIKNDMLPVALHNNQILVFELPSSLPYIDADKGRLRQVIFNLLNNSFKFTPNGGKITFRAGVEDKNLLVEVEDNGIGISEEDQKRLFEPYFRRTSDRERLSGLGLGLALSKSFVELHGGRIWVESQPGKGSIFRFTLPIKHDIVNE